MIVYAPLMQPWNELRIHWLLDWNYEFIARDPESCILAFRASKHVTNERLRTYRAFDLNLERVP